MTTLVAFRPYDAATDEGLIYKDWLNGFRGSHYAGALPRPIYYAAYRETIKYLLERPNVEVAIAHLPGEDARFDAFGWICFERGFDRPCVHFFSVKEDYRRQGVEAALLEHAGAHGPHYFTFRLQAAREFMPLGVHRPELVWFEGPRAKKLVTKRHSRDERRARSDAPSRQLDKMRVERRREARNNLEETD